MRRKATAKGAHAEGAEVSRRARRRTSNNERNVRDVGAMGAREEEVTAECGERGQDRRRGWGSLRGASSLLERVAWGVRRALTRWLIHSDPGYWRS
jgi:hypothetical protein